MDAPTNIRPDRQYALFDTRIGVCGLAWSDRGLTRLQLPQSDRRAAERRLRASGASPGPERPPPAIEQAIAQVVRYATGSKVDFAAIAVDLTDVEPFHRKVYDAARCIGWGQTTTYGELARQIGVPQGAQAVGQALSRNPIPIIIPCHRILASGRKLGGFSAFGGRFAKDRLLALEGVGRSADEPLLPGIVAPVSRPQ